MKKQILDYSILKETISKSNVIAMAELIALSEPTTDAMSSPIEINALHLKLKYDFVRME